MLRECNKVAKHDDDDDDDDEVLVYNCKLLVTGYPLPAGLQRDSGF